MIPADDVRLDGGARLHWMDLMTVTIVFLFSSFSLACLWYDA